jgi:hypothetical protein
MYLSLTHYGYQPPGYGKIATFIIQIVVSVVHLILAAGIVTVMLIVIAVIVGGLDVVEEDVVVPYIAAESLKDGITTPIQGHKVHYIVLHLHQ